MHQKNLHHVEYKEVCHKSNASGRSAYVPGKSVVVIKWVTEGKIKSLHPPCLGKASPVDSHPYICKNCRKQRIDILNLMKKGKTLHYLLRDLVLEPVVSGRSMLQNRKLNLNLIKLIKIVQLTRENKSLRKFCYGRKFWEEILSEACDLHNEKKLVSTKKSYWKNEIRVKSQVHRYN